MRIRFKATQYIAFISAHVTARDLFESQFTADQELGSVEVQVLQESEDQVKEAEKLLVSFPPVEVQFVLSLMLAKCLLNNAVTYIQELVDSSLLKSAEAEEALETIQESLKAIGKSSYQVITEQAFAKDKSQPDFKQSEISV